MWYRQALRERGRNSNSNQLRPLNTQHTHTHTHTQTYYIPLSHALSLSLPLMPHSHAGWAQDPGMCRSHMNIEQERAASDKARDGLVPLAGGDNASHKHTAGHIHTAHITKYGSTLYIGMDEVLAHYACTFQNLVSFLFIHPYIHSFLIRRIFNFLVDNYT